MAKARARASKADQADRAALVLETLAEAWGLKKGAHYAKLAEAMREIARAVKRGEIECRIKPAAAGEG